MALPALQNGPQLLGWRCSCRRPSRGLWRGAEYVGAQIVSRNLPANCRLYGENLVSRRLLVPVNPVPNVLRLHAQGASKCRLRAYNLNCLFQCVHAGTWYTCVYKCQQKNIHRNDKQ